MPIPAGQLVKKQVPTSVTLTTSLVVAIELMIKYEFSQLPVVDENNKPIGIITGSSIASALLLFVDSTVKDLEVKDAVVRLVTHPRRDNDILDITDEVLRASAILLTEADGTLASILTSYDTTQYFRTRAEDISLLEDIEKNLKGHLESANKGEEQRRVINKVSNPVVESHKRGEESLKALFEKLQLPVNDDYIQPIVNKYFPLRESIKTFDDLTLEELIQAAENTPTLLNTLFNKNAKKQKSWARMMRNISGIRNTVFHFKGELSEVERQSLRFCATWYRLHQPIQDDGSTESTTGEEKISTLQDLPDDNEEEPDTTNKDSALNLQSNSNAEGDEDISLINVRIRPQNFEESIVDKYRPFALFLKYTLLETDYNFVTTIYLIEKLIHQSLPKAAREHPSWWTDYSTHSRQWLLAGWRVGAINLNSQRVEFYRWSHYINRRDPEDLQRWADKFEISNEDLLKIIKMIGPLATVVGDYIESNKPKY